MKARLGLVVPALTMGGGVPAVARFLSDVASRDGRANLKLVSLSMDSRDPQGLRFGSPRSWLDETRQSQGLGMNCPTPMWAQSVLKSSFNAIVHVRFFGKLFLTATSSKSSAVRRLGPMQC